MDLCILKKDYQDTVYTDPRMVIKAGEQAEVIEYNEKYLTVHSLKSIYDPIFFPRGISVTALVAWEDIELI